MLFTSIDFLLFLPIVFVLYWFAFHRSLKVQNFFILVASYVFYGWWDWRFLILIFATSLFSYLSGVLIERSDTRLQQRLVSGLNIALNIGILGFFKYYDFFVDSFIESFGILGLHLHARTLSVILPVGISFYTFQALSYSIDVYNKRLKPTHDFISFLAYVSFFPQLVAGPIERATHFLPQFFKKRSFDYIKAVDGMRQILWGFFKKIVIADTCGRYVDIIFNNSESMPASALVVGAIYFAFQIYGDFSGYSDIAIGTARLFGFDLIQNFNFPYFSRDIAEFWRRWHISLTTWFRDYLYIPLGGSRVSKPKVIRNIFIVFIVSGFWHGANWTFIIWGVINAIYFLPLLLLKRNRQYTNTVAEGRIFPRLKEIMQMGITFVLTTFAWIFFRADSVSDALFYIKGIFSSSILKVPHQTGLTLTIPLIVFMLLVEWIQRNEQYGLAKMKLPTVVRWIIYVSLCILCFSFYRQEQIFIYFQF